jgi:hypothetical protein
LLDAGADPARPTRIDDHETPLEMALRANLGEIATLLSRELSDRRRSTLHLHRPERLPGFPVVTRHGDWA